MCRKAQTKGKLSDWRLVEGLKKFPKPTFVPFGVQKASGAHIIHLGTGFKARGKSLLGNLEKTKEKKRISESLGL